MINYISLKPFFLSLENFSRVRCSEALKTYAKEDLDGLRVLFRINRPLLVLSQLWIIFTVVKHSKFPTCWQQVSRRVIQHARLKFQSRTYRISAAPVAKRFEFASEQYFPPRFGLISGIISLICARACRAASRSASSVSIFKYYRRILGTSSLPFPPPRFSYSSPRNLPCFFFSSDRN